jgi:MFS family permease
VHSVGTAAVLLYALDDRAKYRETLEVLATMTAERDRPPTPAQPPLSDIEAAPTSRHVWAVFFLFVVTDVLLSVDSGALPVALPSISARFDLTRFNQGTLGALSPAGFALATTYVGVLLQHHSPRYLLTAGLGVTAVASTAFAAAPTPALLYLSRFCYGVAYAVFFIFAPVWITMYAPENRATSWISMIQAGAPIGAVAGLVCGGIVAGNDLSWRITFFIQAAVIGACMAAFSVVPSRFIDGGSSAEALTASSNQTASPLAHHHLPEATTFSTSPRPGARSAGLRPSSSGVRAEVICASTTVRSSSLSPKLAAQSAIATLPHLSGQQVQPASTDLSEVVLLSSPRENQTAIGGIRVRTGGPVLGGSGENLQELSNLQDEDHHVSLLVDGGSEAINAGSSTYLARRQRDPSVAESEATSKLKPTLSEQLAMLASNRVFVNASLALGFLTFTVEGIRYWVVLYRTEVFHEELSTVVAAFTLVSSTAPILGMFFGGGLIDRCGGYRTKEGVARSMRILMGFSLCAGPSAALILLGDIGTKSSLRFFSFSTWLLLFFGGAHVAPLTGIMIAAVPDDMRPLSSAVSLLVNHIVGFFFAPFGVGILANMKGIKMGFQAVISASAVAITFGFLGWLAAEKDYRSHKVARAAPPRSRRRSERQSRGEDIDSVVPLFSPT